LKWDQSKVKITPDAAREALRNGHPSIESVGGKESLDMTTWMMIPGEERIVAKRVKEVLQQASS
jgi:L-seryl-tRNA(Ser) seleniumtransferase